MPIDYAQMRDCILDALTDQVLSLERPSEMVVTWAAMKSRTQQSAIVHGLLDGAQTAFHEADDKLFGQALWVLFQEGILAPVFKHQRYGGKGWEEGEFKLTARGLRGFQTTVAPKQDVEGYLLAIRQAAQGLRSHAVVAAFADQAVRAARADLWLAAAEMTSLALEAALADLAEAWLAGVPAALPPAPRVGLPGLLAWLEAALAGSEAPHSPLASPEARDGLARILASAGAIASPRGPDGQLTASAPSAQEIDAGLAALPGCLAHTSALVRRCHVQAQA